MQECSIGVKKVAIECMMLIGYEKSLSTFGPVARQGQIKVGGREDVEVEARMERKKLDEMKMEEHLQVEMPTDPSQRN